MHILIYINVLLKMHNVKMVEAVHNLVLKYG